MAQNIPRGTPARVLIVFALLGGAVAVSTIQDARKNELFRVTYPTAVGDDSYYKSGGEPVQITVNGSVFSLHEVAGERILRRDDRVFRVPLSVPVPRLYTTTDSSPPNEIPPLYLKTADGEYQRVELQAGAGKSEEGETTPRSAGKNP
ncbi:MAG TPA: hypothetical protein VHM91_00880 [Verrucomicrobiales bacterium]|jgi:hypothetical protein|nr:hypothetical protein [Verrucomicrobiales bacterium]